MKISSPGDSTAEDGHLQFARCDICRPKNASDDWHSWALFMQCRARAFLVDLHVSHIFSHVDRGDGTTSVRNPV